MVVLLIFCGVGLICSISLIRTSIDFSLTTTSSKDNPDLGRSSDSSIAPNAELLPSAPLKLYLLDDLSPCNCFV